MERRHFEVLAAAVKYFEAVETHTLATKAAKFTPDIDPPTRETGSEDNRPDTKHKTRNRETLPNMKIDPLDESERNLHIDIHTDSIGIEEQRAT